MWHVVSGTKARKRDERRNGALPGIGLLLSLAIACDGGGGVAGGVMTAFFRDKFLFFRGGGLAITGII